MSALWGVRCESGRGEKEGRWIVLPSGEWERERRLENGMIRGRNVKGLSIYSIECKVRK